MAPLSIEDVYKAHSKGMAKDAKKAVKIIEKSLDEQLARYERTETEQNDKGITYKVKISVHPLSTFSTRQQKSLSSLQVLLNDEKYQKEIKEQIEADYLAQKGVEQVEVLITGEKAHHNVELTISNIPFFVQKGAD